MFHTKELVLLKHSQSRLETNCQLFSVNLINAYLV